MTTHAASPARSSPSHRLVMRRIRLLLVDDHHMVRQALRSHMARWSDIELVGEAADGEEAVRLADTLSPDVVVMDIRMPRMNGIEATRLIIEAHPSVCVIGLSFEAGTPKEEALLKAGACMVLDKGASSKQLHHTISQTVDRHRSACLPRGR
jgi:DNA-binding NarL/FixJ family response regulator